MDVVLLQDVERLGARGALVKVKPGFARNYLLPRGLAAPATEAQRRAVAEAARQQAQKTQRARGQAEALKQRLEARPVTLTLSLGADGKSFGAVTAHDILEALTRDGVALEKHAVRLDQPLKALGTHEVAVRVSPDVSATVKVVIVKA